MVDVVSQLTATHLTPPPLPFHDAPRPVVQRRLLVIFVHDGSEKQHVYSFLADRAAVHRHAGQSGQGRPRVAAATG